MNKKIKVFYNENQNVEKNSSFSPSAGKPKKFVESIKDFDYIEIVKDFQPFSRNDFYLGHDKDHVDNVLNCTKQNGFENKLKEVADSLYWTNASFFAAAKYAFENKTFSCSPTSGFHHATYNECMGFCTFNGLTLTAVKLKQMYPDILISVIDIDAHYGNGTDNIINLLHLKDFIHHFTFGEIVNDLNRKNLFYEFEVLLKEELNKYTKYCDLILYQSGADPHIEDPHGGYFTTEELRKRDEIIFQFAKENKIPVAWNLAGGYHKNFETVLDIHRNTVTEANKWIL
jgi:acetoin utilization deacetylase AcuC-like enzyme